MFNVSTAYSLYWPFIIKYSITQWLNALQQIFIEVSHSWPFCPHNLFCCWESFMHKKYLITIPKPIYKMTCIYGWPHKRQEIHRSIIILYQIATLNEYLRVNPRTPSLWEAKLSVSKAFSFGNTMVLASDLYVTRSTFNIIVCYYCRTLRCKALYVFLNLIYTSTLCIIVHF